MTRTGSRVGGTAQSGFNRFPPEADGRVSPAPPGGFAVDTPSSSAEYVGFGGQRGIPSYEKATRKRSGK